MRTIVAAILALFMVLFAVFAFVSAAHARTAIGAGGGVIEGDPATLIFLEVDEPNSHVHVRPTLLFRRADDDPGVWQVEVDAYWHSAPCQETGLYVGGGVGAEWLPEVKVGVPTTQPNSPPPPPVDPPSPVASAMVGLRSSSERFDAFVEARAIFTRAETLVGPFVGVLFHAPRKVRHGHNH